MSVEIRTLVRSMSEQFEPIETLRSFAGDCDYMPGAIELAVDGIPFLTAELWDDVNWLWPFFLQVLTDCRAKGSGERYFPDQPILIRARSLGVSGYVSLELDGPGVTCQVQASGEELYPAVARAGLLFFAEFTRLCGRTVSDEREVALMRNWLSENQ